MTTFRKATQAGPLDYYRRVQQLEATLREGHEWARAARRHATVALWSSGAAILLAVAALLTTGIFWWTTQESSQSAWPTPPRRSPGARELQLLREVGQVCTVDSTFVHAWAGAWLPKMPPAMRTLE